MGDPVFVLAPPRSFTSVVSTMLGQHPQMFGLPETNLFLTDTVDQWWRAHETHQLGFGRPGLLRTIAELYFDDQSEEAIQQASIWILRRRSWPTAFLFVELIKRVHPAMLVEKSPTVTLYPDCLQRMLHHFPRSRFIHLLRDPSTQRSSLLSFLGMNGDQDPRHRGAFLDAAAGREWFLSHSNIRRFLAPLPEEQSMRVRGEDVLADPDTHLRAISRWLGLRADDDAIEKMKHPEHSPFACFGPPSAPLGNDPLFLSQPRFRARVQRDKSSTRTGQGTQEPIPLPQPVQRLAKELGYS